MRVALTSLVAACSQPTSPSQPKQIPQLAVFDLAGDWRWLYRAEEAGTSRVEKEDWKLISDPAEPNRLVGRYIRTVDVASLDHAPFQCNERPAYRQRAIYDVVGTLVGNELVIEETGYRTEPSPCDHGFRHTGQYRAPINIQRLALTWDHGTETLWHVGNTGNALPDAPWPAAYVPTGTWRWSAESTDSVGNHRTETEWWEITRRNATQLDATYRRRVTIKSADGTAIACAGAPSWSFDDAYVLDGQKEEDHWHFHELAVEPGDHPCLRATPKRVLDEATAEQIGDYLVLEWRGKRHEILYRPSE